MSSEYEVFEVAVSEELPPPLPRTEHSGSDRTQARDLFERLATLPSDDPERARRFWAGLLGSSLEVPAK